MQMYPTREMTELSLQSSLLLALEHPVVLNALLSTTSDGIQYHLRSPSRHKVNTIYFKGQAI